MTEVSASIFPIHDTYVYTCLLSHFLFYTEHWFSIIFYQKYFVDHVQLFDL